MATQGIKFKFGYVQGKRVITENIVNGNITYTISDDGKEYIFRTHKYSKILKLNDYVDMFQIICTKYNIEPDSIHSGHVRIEHKENKIINKDPFEDLIELNLIDISNEMYILYINKIIDYEINLVSKWHTRINNVAIEKFKNKLYSYELKSEDFTNGLIKYFDIKYHHGFFDLHQTGIIGTPYTLELALFDLSNNYDETQFQKSNSPMLI